ncbi:hypothetical protein ACSS6W_000599 [Trichoderma asperelloides]
MKQQSSRGWSGWGVLVPCPSLGREQTAAISPLLRDFALVLVDAWIMIQSDAKESLIVCPRCSAVVPCLGRRVYIRQSIQNTNLVKNNNSAAHPPPLLQPTHRIVIASFTLMEQIRPSTPLSLFEYWLLAILIHVNLAWLICTTVVSIGHATEASWLPTLPPDGDDSGFALFWAASKIVFRLWLRLLVLLISLELIGMLAWGVVCLRTLWSSGVLNPPFPLIFRIFFAARFGFMWILRIFHR